MERRSFVASSKIVPSSTATSSSSSFHANGSVKKERIALIMGVANHRSLAWHCVLQLLEQPHDHYDRIVVTYQQERFRNTVETLLQSVSSNNKQVQLSCLPCDVTDDASVKNLFDVEMHQTLLQQQQLQQQNNGDEKELELTALIHSIAHAPSDAMKGSLMGSTNRQAFMQAHDASAYSLLNVVQKAYPYLSKSDNDGGSSVTCLSYLGAARAVPNYNIMGPAKASLESLVRGLALELGPSNIRVNAVSAGPIPTLAARGITNFQTLRQESLQRQMLQRHISPKEVAQTVAFIASPLASGITAQTIFVDGGYNSHG